MKFEDGSGAYIHFGSKKGPCSYCNKETCRQLEGCKLDIDTMVDFTHEAHKRVEEMKGDCPVLSFPDAHRLPQKFIYDWRPFWKSLRIYPKPVPRDLDALSEENFERIRNELKGYDGLYVVHVRAINGKHEGIPLNYSPSAKQYIFDVEVLGATYARLEGLSTLEDEGLKLDFDEKGDGVLRLPGFDIDNPISCASGGSSGGSQYMVVTDGAYIRCKVVDFFDFYGVTYKLRSLNGPHWAVTFAGDDVWFAGNFWATPMRKKASDMFPSHA